MTDELAERAFNDLDEIAADAGRALDKLAHDDVEGAQDILTDIKQTAEAWETPDAE